MEKRKRPCTVDNSNDTRWMVRRAKFNGLFHDWGLEHGRTVGIIEDEEGKIYLIAPEYIKFTDK